MNGKPPFVNVIKVRCIEPGVLASDCYFVCTAGNTDAVQIHGIISAETLDVLSCDHNLFVEIRAPGKEPNP